MNQWLEPVTRASRESSISSQQPQLVWLTRILPSTITPLDFTSCGGSWDVLEIDPRALHMQSRHSAQNNTYLWGTIWYCNTLCNDQIKVMEDTFHVEYYHLFVLGIFKVSSLLVMWSIRCTWLSVVTLPCSKVMGLRGCPSTLNVKWLYSHSKLWASLDCSQDNISGCGPISLHPSA